jgi:hypothetical protein
LEAVELGEVAVVVAGEVAVVVGGALFCVFGSFLTSGVEPDEAAPPV